MQADVVFRVDAGGPCGLGHLSRCKALAAELIRTGCSVCFVCRDRNGLDASLLTSFQYSILPLAKSQSEWLTTTTEADFKEFSSVVSSRIVVVDHYGIGSDWHDSAREKNYKVVVVDDLRNRKVAADLVIDYQLDATDEQWQKLNKIKSGRHLLGPNFALINPQFSVATPDIQNNKMALVYLGSADSSLLERLALAVLNSVIPAKLVTVITGSDQTAMELRGKRPEFSKIIGAVPTLIPYYEQSRMIFGASGVSSMERLAIGVPSVSFVVADNQLAVAANLESRNLVLQSLDLRTCTDAELELTIKNAWETSDSSLVEIAALGKNVCDGKGSTRAAAIIKEML